MDDGAATAAVPKSDSLQLPRDAFCRRGRYPGWGEAALHAGAQVCVGMSVQEDREARNYGPLRLSKSNDSICWIACKDLVKIVVVKKSK
jgi:hypothetical protein